MNQYTIVPAHGQPDWAKIPLLNVENFQWLPESDIRMQAQICYDESALYVRLQAKEQAIRARHTQPLSMVCEDSCMEFFFRPLETDLRYFNIEINPNGCTYIGFGPNLAGLVRLVPQNEDKLLDKQVCRTPEGWVASYRVPVSLIRVFFPDFRLVPGIRIYANCYKCGDLTVAPHYISWNPIDSPTPCFHKPEDFGLMILG